MDHAGSSGQAFTSSGGQRGSSGETFGPIKLCHSTLRFFGIMMPFFKLGIHRNNAREFAVATLCGSSKVRSVDCMTEPAY
jgi:hypothetical protein